MKGTNTDTIHKPNPCQTAHKAESGHKPAPAVQNEEAVKDAIREALGT